MTRSVLPGTGYTREETLVTLLTPPEDFLDFRFVGAIPGHSRGILIGGNMGKLLLIQALPIPAIALTESCHVVDTDARAGDGRVPAADPRIAYDSGCQHPHVRCVLRR